MIINSLYKKYFQKSKIFLYPLLNIHSECTFKPLETYFSWDNVYSNEDLKLICVYHTPNMTTYINFEKNILLKHNRLYDYHKIDSTTSVYVFDFSDLSKDWNYIVTGKYSKINPVLKQKILSYFKNNMANKIYISSYLYPEVYYGNYAKLLGVNPELLEEVGELCTIPDLNKEILLIKRPTLKQVDYLCDLKPNYE